MSVCVLVCVADIKKCLQFVVPHGAIKRTVASYANWPNTQQVETFPRLLKGGREWKGEWEWNSSRIQLLNLFATARL